MECDGILLEINGREICFPLFYPIFDPGDRPDPPWHIKFIDILTDPQNGAVISREIAQDIAVLVTMNQLATRLSPEMRSAVQPALQEVAKRQQLPAGMRIEL